MGSFKTIVTMLIMSAFGLIITYLVLIFKAEGLQNEPIKAIFLSKSKEVKPSMRKVLQMDNIRVHQYTDSIGTYTIFASEFDFLSNTSNQIK